MTDLVDHALTTVADVKELMGISSGDTSKDNLIKRKINQATFMIERYTGRRFKSASYTEYINATGTDQIVLTQRPITAISNIGLRQTSLNENDFETVDANLYFYDANSNDAKAGVIDLAYNVVGGYDRVKVEYTAGYTTIPADLQEAAASLAAFLVDNSTAGTNVRSKQEGQRKVEYFDSQQNGASLFDQLGIDEILKSYANYPLAVS